MQFKLLAVALAAALPFASAYPITGTTVNCRSGPSTSDKIIKSYNKNDDVKISCQTTGESINGNPIWDKTTDDCYVADYYVKTGSSGMVTKDCDPGKPGSSETNGPITRQEIIERGQHWVRKHIPYSMSNFYPDQQGVKYRTDCSGFVSMALHTTAPGRSTVSLPEIGTAIAWKDLKVGDFVGTLGAGTDGADGHVTLFNGWADSAHKRYKTLECMGSKGCVAYERAVGWKVGSHVAKPYRYKNVKD
ncbi:hypothetical protein J3459_008626 [Metarhizium acridum]|uniref:NlpC/P60-like cell-wall peptidase n=1 Tax=Metarhizium acridum (strain CQMa 102) TaxID=655827 RepID=E9E8U8_METAQ|nr:NlpC/P60-like cell-wall peptidase [Metarhizium acridum CQMa 102]EFY87702.1 NlpC/P60-like cell-wall peptidase [Metarhizium acridum CQMa 102]KAG8409097.1 hypothetical protein J3459_017800 [Metarhizium acridum]KAG8425932.1 hypothetical protein J3459_008626 [Metarhizium acridum]